MSHTPLALRLAYREVFPTAFLMSPRRQYGLVSNSGLGLGQIVQVIIYSQANSRRR